MKNRGVETELEGITQKHRNRKHLSKFEKIEKDNTITVVSRLWITRRFFKFKLLRNWHRPRK